MVSDGMLSGLQWERTRTSQLHVKSQNPVTDAYISQGSEQERDSILKKISQKINVLYKPRTGMSSGLLDVTRWGV